MLRPPDFVDGHQHVQALPAIRGALLDALEQRRLQGKCWLRDSGDSLHRIFLRGAQVKKALLVRGLATGFRRAARRAGFVVNDGFAGFSEFNPGHDYAAQFEVLSARARTAPSDHVPPRPRRRRLARARPGDGDARAGAGVFAVAALRGNAGAAGVEVGAASGLNEREAPDFTSRTS